MIRRHHARSLSRVEPEIADAIRNLADACVMPQDPLEREVWINAKETETYTSSQRSDNSNNIDGPEPLGEHYTNPSS